MSQPQHFRIFLSSPRDVTEERTIARQVIDSLQYEPSLRDVRVECVAWDDPNVRTPMLANKTPQQAIDEGLTRPSECDIVVVVLWSRFGTPLDVEKHGTKEDGTPYLSGTEWEFWDAARAAHLNQKPDILVYRRTEKILLDPDASDYDERFEQYRNVKLFFANFRDPNTGAHRKGFNEYASAADFQKIFENDIRELLRRSIQVSQPRPKMNVVAVHSSAPIWEGSPFPGLRAFRAEDAPIYFGRVYEAEDLLRRVGESRFVALVGASGSGKSSLVWAGLIPRLQANVLNGSRDWFMLRCTPGEVGDNPFMALAVQCVPYLKHEARDLAADLAGEPSLITNFVAEMLEGQEDWVELLLFIDQFEELFTLVAPSYRTDFIDLMVEATKLSRVRIVATLRADFYHYTLEYPALLDLMKNGTYPLAVPSMLALYEMIVRPAALAGLKFENRLPERIFTDMDNAAGALPLLQFTLERLYEMREGVKLTQDAYKKIGGVQGAIGNHADVVFATLDAETQSALPRVAAKLVSVDNINITRRRASKTEFDDHEPSKRLVDALINARLLVVNQADDVYVEVTHEALLTSWKYFAEIIEKNKDGLRQLRRLELDAKDWENLGRPKGMLWQHERLKLVYDFIDRLGITFDIVTAEFAKPEPERLLEEFKDENNAYYHKRAIVDELTRIGEAAIPSMIEAFHYLSSYDAPIRDSLIDTLCRYPSKSFAWLTKLLQDQDYAVRRMAIHALRRIMPQDGMRSIVGDKEYDNTVNLIINLLKDEYVGIAQTAAWTLGAIENKQSVQALLAALEDKRGAIYGVATQVLATIKSDDAVEIFIEALKDNNIQIRFIAANALGEIGDKRAVQPLMSALADLDMYVRRAVVQALGNVGDERATEVLIAALNNFDAEMRAIAAMALGQIKDERATKPLKAILQQDDNGLVKIAIAWALIQYDDFQGAGLLLSALGSKWYDIHQKRKFAEALEKWGTPEALDVVRKWREGNS